MAMGQKPSLKISMTAQANKIMKKTFAFLCLLATMLTCLTSCEKSTKDKLTGSWDFSTTLSSSEFDGTAQGSKKLNSDGSFYMQGTVTLSGPDYSLGYELEMAIVVTFEESGDWDVNGENIVYSPSNQSCELVKMEYKDPDSGESLVLSGDDLDGLRDSFEKEVGPSIFEVSSEKIILLKDNKFVTEEQSNDGSTIKYTYTR